jgi:CheY-like chemotaxis protein
MDLPFPQENDGLGSNADDEPDGRSSAPSVLVVERNRSTRQLMWRVLQPAYETQMAATYEELRRHAQDRAYDAVVMSLYSFDVDDGRQLLEDLRATTPYAERPIIAVCHPSVEAGSERLREDGFDDVLRMPFGESDLLSVLDRHLGPS